MISQSESKRLGETVGDADAAALHYRDAALGFAQMAPAASDTPATSLRAGPRELVP
jgi:hypothetical protein